MCVLERTRRGLPGVSGDGKLVLLALEDGVDVGVGVGEGTGGSFSQTSHLPLFYRL